MKEKGINLVTFVRDYPVGMAGTKRVHNFLEYLLSRNILINVISFRSQNRQPSVKGTYKSIPYVNVGSGIKMRFTEMPGIILYYVKGLYSILRFRKRGFVNIIYNSGGINIENFVFILWTKIIGYKLVLAIEEDYTFFQDDIKAISRFKFWTVRRFDFLNCRWADAIVVISNHLRNKYLKLKATNVILIPVTASLNINHNKSSFNSPLQIVYAGTFADKDGVDDIIRGFMAFNKSDENAILILTGNSEQQLLYKDKYQNEKNIFFKGFIEDNEFYSLIRNADVLCMCRTESGFANAGFPFKLGEYLATGNPVICTRVSDVELYLDNEDAFLINPGSPVQVCESLNRIICDPEAARKTGLKGLEKCRKYFSPELNGQILYDTLKLISKQ